MWFNNIIVYQLTTPFDKTIEASVEALAAHRLKPCPPHARKSQGWISPLSHIEESLYSMASCHILVAATESRLLPASITRATLEEKMQAYELLHHKPMRRADRLQLKEDIEFDLLPKAFTVRKKDYLYIDTVKQWVVLNNANPNKAAETMALLNKTLGSMAAKPLLEEMNLSELFVNWLREPLAMPTHLLLQQNCTLVKGNGDKSRYHCKDIEENNDEILHLLEQGYAVSSIELAWENRIQFTLTDNFQLKRIKSLDYLDDAFKEHDQLSDKQEKFNANFTLLAGEMRKLLTFLLAACTENAKVLDAA